MKKEAIVYWYRLEHHNNPYKEGYIGVTTNQKKRHLEHFRNADKGVSNHFYNAIRKYGKEQIKKEILFKGSESDAYLLELEYREASEIGWNHAIGGSNGAMNQGIKIQLYHQSNIVQLLTFDSIKEAAQYIGTSRSALSKLYRTKNTVYNRLGWAILFDPTFDRTTTMTISELVSSKLKGKKKSQPSVWKGKKDRWTEEQKVLIGSYHKGKKLSKEHIRALSEHNKLHSPKCRPIELKHKDNPTKIYKFHSISEASRQLDIPLSRLKSKVQRPLNRYGRDGWAVHKYNT